MLLFINKRLPTEHATNEVHWCWVTRCSEKLGAPKKYSTFSQSWAVTTNKVTEIVLHSAAACGQTAGTTVTSSEYLCMPAWHHLNKGQLLPSFWPKVSHSSATHLDSYHRTLSHSFFKFATSFFFLVPSKSEQHKCKFLEASAPCWSAVFYLWFAH